MAPHPLRVELHALCRDDVILWIIQVISLIPLIIFFLQSLFSSGLCLNCIYDSEMHSEENSCNLIGLKIYPPLLFLLYWKIHGTTEGWQMLFSLEANTGLCNTSEEKTRQKHMDSDPPSLSHWGKGWEGGDMHPDISNQIINHLVCSQPWTSISLSSNQAICWKFLRRTHNPVQNEDSQAPPPNYCSHLGSLTGPLPTSCWNQVASMWPPHGPSFLTSFLFP